jgi:FMN phosphatase YigB (HAD superfamily)
MDRTARDALGLRPCECLFVDAPVCVLGALELGYHACGISRYEEPRDDGLNWARSIDDVLDLVSGLNQL